MELRSARLTNNDNLRMEFVPTDKPSLELAYCAAVAANLLGWDYWADIDEDHADEVEDERFEDFNIEVVFTENQRSSLLAELLAFNQTGVMPILNMNMYEGLDEEEIRQAKENLEASEYEGVADMTDFALLTGPIQRAVAGYYDSGWLLLATTSNGVITVQPGGSGAS